MQKYRLEATVGLKKGLMVKSYLSSAPRKDEPDVKSILHSIWNPTGSKEMAANRLYQLKHQNKDSIYVQTLNAFLQSMSHSMKVLGIQNILQPSLCFGCIYLTGDTGKTSQWCGIVLSKKGRYKSSWNLEQGEIQVLVVLKLGFARSVQLKQKE